MIGMSSVNDGYVSAATGGRIDLDGDQLEKYSLAEGDLLFNRTNSYELVCNCSSSAY
jgi:hypothetical protein